MKKNKHLDRLFEKWQARREYSTFIKDGIIDEELFGSDGRQKILVIAKEANTNESGDFREWWNYEMKYTFSRRIAEWCHGIFHHFPSFEKITNEDRHFALKCISFMDVKKSGGGGRSNSKEIFNCVHEDKDLILKEIEIIDPEIIISCIGYESNVELFGKGWHKTGYWVDHKIVQSRLILDFYHPSNQGGAPMGYVLLEKVLNQIKSRPADSEFFQ